MKLKIHGKLLLYVLTTTVVFYLVTFIYILIQNNENANNNAVKITEEVTKRYVSIVKSELQSDYLVTKAYRQLFKKYPEATEKEKIEIFNPVLKTAVLDNPNFMSVWYTWEYSVIKKNYKKSHGRSQIGYYRQNEKQGYTFKELDTKSENIGSTYYNIKINPHELLVDPYYANYTSKTKDNILMSSIVIPIYHKSKFAGLVGIDISLERFKKITEKIKAIKGAKSFIVANNANIVTFSDENLENSAISEYFKNKITVNDSIVNINKSISSGKSLFFKYSVKQKEYLVNIQPLAIGTSSTPWAIGIMIPTSEMALSVYRSTFTFILSFVLGFIAMSIVIWFFAKRITKPLKETTDVLINLSKGNIDDNKKLVTDSEDEISEISNAVNIVIESLKKTAQFAGEIGKGNLDYKYIPLSENDTLGNSLIEMRKSLDNAREEEEKRKEEDRKLTWATLGTANFAEILRTHSDSLEKLSYAIISELTKYIGANQGGLFILNEDKDKNKTVELLASYAFDRKKILTKRIPYGVGLIGRCMLERDIIYMENIPSEYINITSGLGEDNPNVLIVLPLIFNEEVLGAVEIASFNKIEQYKVDFIKKIGESIASTISMVKINIRTAQLLQDTKIKSEEMASQEEEIRQNVEELKSSREELNSKVTELQNTLRSYNSISYTVEYDTEGRITDINENFLKLFGRKKEDYIGKYQGSFTDKPQNVEKFNEFWNMLRRGHNQHFEQELDKGDEKILINFTYTPVYNKEVEIYKVIAVANVR